MTTEAMAAPDATAQIPASDTAQQNPETADPEINEQERQQDPANANQGDDADKSLKRLQRRIDRVTAARYEAQAEARQLREQLARYQQADAQPQDEQRPPTEDDIERRAQELSMVREVMTRSNRTYDEGVKAYGEAFERDVATLKDAAGDLINARGLPTPLGEAILDSDKAHELIHYLAENDDIAAELKGLSAARLGRRLSAIEAELSKPKEPKPSKAPKPLEPVKAGAGSTGEPDMKDTAAWIAWRNKQDRSR